MLLKSRTKRELVAERERWWGDADWGEAMRGPTGFEVNSR